MMSLLGITLPANPQIQTAGAGDIQYTNSSQSSTNQQFSITTTDLNLVDTSGHNDLITPDSQNTQAGAVQILVSSSGNLVHGDGPSGEDIALAGQVTVGSTTYNGVLLTGTISQFGYQFANLGPINTANFDFRFRATGGLLESVYFTGKDVGMKISATSNTQFSSGLTGPNENWPSFNLTSNVKGFVGPIAPSQNSPTIQTSATENNGNAVGTSLLSDSATLGGSYQGTGSIDFKLTQPDGTTVDEGTVSVNGDGSYFSPAVVASQVGTYTWLAVYSGDTFNNGAIDNGVNESLTVVKASPTITTRATSATGDVVGTVALSDTATLAGSYAGTGTIDFTLTQPDGTLVDEGNVVVSGDGGYTSPTVIGTQVGTYTWTATYSGDSLNNGAVDSGTNESLTTIKSSPVISTQASVTGDTTVGQANLSDTVSVSGGDGPTGTVTFMVTQPDGSIALAGSATITGDGIYPSPAFIATQVGTYTFNASYSGDSLNSASLDDGQNESVTTTEASPSITTTPVPSSSVILGTGTVILKDTAVLSGAYNPAGTITFTLVAPDGSTVLDTESVSVSTDGSYTTPNGYTLSTVGSVVGTYQWNATFTDSSGKNTNAFDLNNVSEQVSVGPASPMVVTTASSGVTLGTTAPSVSDSAVLANGYYETGNLVFTLTGPNGFSYTQTDPVSGNNTYTAGTTLPTAGTVAGTYTWQVSYSGDSNNNVAVDHGGTAEQIVVSPAAPSIVTSQLPTTITVGGTISDQATVSGYNPTGTVTFNLYDNVNASDTPIFTDAKEPLVNGVAVSSGYSTVMAGIDYWVATYNGDANNGAVSSKTDEEPVSITPTEVGSLPSSLVTVAGPDFVLGSGSSLLDSAFLTGFFNPTGTLTFSLYSPSGNVVHTEAVTVAGNGSYPTPTGYQPSVAGTYQWLVQYSGDVNNEPASTKLTDEPEVVNPAGSSTATAIVDASGGPLTAALGESVYDTTTVTGTPGITPTGTVTYEFFNTLNGTGSHVDQTVTLTAGGVVPQSAATAALVAGSYSYIAVYSGDPNYLGSTGAVEPLTIQQGTLSLLTVIHNAADASVVTGPLPLGSSVYDTYTLVGTQPLAFSGTVSYTFNGNPAGSGAQSLTEGPLHAGNDAFQATASGDSNYVITPSAPELLTINPAQLSIITTIKNAADNSTVTGSLPLGSTVYDTATVSGQVPGFAVGAISFSFNGSSIANNGAGQSVNEGPLGAGSDSFQASVANTSDYIGALSTLEPLTILKTTPAISTVAGPTIVIGSGVKLTDTASFTGGFNPTGTITFSLLSPGNVVVYTDVVTVTGSGPYTTAVGNNPGGYLPTAAGTYQWSATYNGDANNISVHDNGQNESETVNYAQPAIVTTPSQSTINLSTGTVTLKDTAVISGGYNPTGSVKFTLVAPGGATLDTETVAINGNGSYPTPTGYTLPTNASVTGVYQWNATYTPGGFNLAASDISDPAERVTVNPAAPTISTSPSVKTYTLCSTTTVLKDSATLAGGYGPFGTITFTLYSPTNTLLDTETVTVNGNGTYTTLGYTLPINAATGVYQWDATYASLSSNTNNLTASDINNPNERVTISPAPSGMISGTKYQDLTGNGFSSDDTPLAGVVIDLYQDNNGNGVYNTGDTKIASTVTAANGTYSFTNVKPGAYVVLEEVPAGWVETGTPLTWSVKVTAGSSAPGINFDDFQEECDLTKFSCIYYVINGTKTVTELSGNVQPGDEVVAYATVAPHYSDELTLVSYMAPDNSFNANDANQQVIYDSKTVSFTTGNSPQVVAIGPVQIPTCNYQIDFVCGPPINTLGPAGSNAFYHQENRMIDSSNGGTQQCSTNGSDISGIVFCDTNVNGILDNGDSLISGATVKLETTAGVVLQTTTTGSNGSYSLENMPAGKYLVVVTASGDTPETSNSVTVTLPNNQNAQTNPMGNYADLNFAELCHCGVIEGCAWDDCNNDGKVDFNECGIVNVMINLNGYDCLGNKVSLSCKTDDDGCYSFPGLLPGCYTLSEGQPGGFTQGTNTCGTVDGAPCGTKQGTDTFCNVQLSNCGDAGANYNFGEHCTTTENKGASASTAFWKNSNGQALLNKLNGSSSSYALGTWLATMFPNSYSKVLVNGKYTNFANMTNAQIASFYSTNDYNVSSAKLNTQVLAAAFNVYVTSTTLSGGSYAATYGFSMSAVGSGYDLINVGSNGAAFGVSNNSTISILQALNATDDDAVNGVLYATSEVVSGVNYSSSTLQGMALTVYTTINNAGGISS